MASREKATFLRTIGSLWLAAAILALLAVAMGAATIFETREGTERALAAFYKSSWFGYLLALLAINLLTAFFVRGPYGRRQIGFLATHAAIFLIFCGAIMTRLAGVDGQLSIAEGQVAGAFRQMGRPLLTVGDQSGRTLAEMPLDPAKFMGYEELTGLQEQAMTLGDLRVQLQHYLPDAEGSRRVVDGQPGGRTALDVVLIADQHNLQATVLAGETTTAGGIPVTFTQTASTKAFEQWLNTLAPAETDSKGAVKLEHEGRAYSFPIEQCMNEPVVIGETGYRIRVTRYLPHAVVGQDRTIVSASSQPVNPYIEAELTGPEGTEFRRAFAKFPEFDSMHGGKTPRAIKLLLEAPTVHASSSPVELLAGPDGRMFARFSGMGGAARTTELTPGTPVETPWQGWKFLVRQKREGAGWEEVVTPVSPVRREGRRPAIQLIFSGADGQKLAWAVYGHPTSVEVGGRAYDVRFDDTMISLGFQLKLDAFRIVTYPGTQRPRSFESRVTIQDSLAGGEMSRVISMNHPLEYGGYTLYQSSYALDEESSISVLSVSRDPGRPIVFAGYIVLLIGMMWVLVKRMMESKRVGQAASAAANAD